MQFYSKVKEGSVELHAKLLRKAIAFEWWHKMIKHALGLMASKTIVQLQLQTAVTRGCHVVQTARTPP